MVWYKTVGFDVFCVNFIEVIFSEKTGFFRRITRKARKNNEVDWCYVRVVLEFGLYQIKSNLGFIKGLENKSKEREDKKKEKEKKSNWGMYGTDPSLQLRGSRWEATAKGGYKEIPAFQWEKRWREGGSFGVYRIRFQNWGFGVSLCYRIHPCLWLV